MEEVSCPYLASFCFRRRDQPCRLCASVCPCAYAVPRMHAKEQRLGRARRVVQAEVVEGLPYRQKVLAVQWLAETHDEWSQHRRTDAGEEKCKVECVNDQGDNHVVRHDAGRAIAEDAATSRVALRRRRAEVQAC